MTKIEGGPLRLVLQSGSTTIVLDKSADTATLERKLLFWPRKPLKRPLSSIAEARVNTSVDAASHAEVCSTMLVMHGGGGWILSARDKQDATKAVTAIREFLGNA